MLGIAPTHFLRHFPPAPAPKFGQVARGLDGTPGGGGQAEHERNTVSADKRVDIQPEQRLHAQFDRWSCIGGVVYAVGGPGRTVERCWRDLIDALNAADIVICADGGAMHIAAGLGKPLVCLFGKSDAQRWRPWGVPYVLLQKPSLDVAGISVAEVAAAFATLHR